MRPMRVFKGKKLPGHMGTLTVTVQNLVIVAVDPTNNVILVKGNVPGPKKSLVVIKSSVKKGDKKVEMEELVSYAPVTEEVTEETPVVEETESTEAETAEVTE